MTRPTFVVALLVFLASTARAGNVRNVSAPGGPVFDEIQAAVDAASDGDALLVGEGTYARFTVDGRSLSIFVMPGATVRVDPTVTIENLAPHQSVVLSGLEVAPPPQSTPFLPAVVVTDCEGVVRFQDCRLGNEHHAYGSNFYCWEYGVTDGATGVVVQGSPRVAFAGSFVFGGPGENVDDYTQDCDGGTGGIGIEAISSSVALYDTEVRGGWGGVTDYYATGQGGMGMSLEDSEVFASGGAIRGWSAGIGHPDFPQGPGGDGVWISSGSVLYVLDCPVVPNHLATAVTGPGEYEPRDGHARRMAAATLVPVHSLLDVTFLGDPGDSVWVPRSLEPDHRFLSAANGVWLTQFPPSVLGAPSGTVSRAGERLALVLALPDLAGAPSGVVTFQGLAVTPLQGRESFGSPSTGLRDRFLSSPREVLALDEDQGPDCNGNGVNDFVDLVVGSSVDANGDLAPDECGTP